MTRIQNQEREKRNRNRLNMMGLRQPLGTKPPEYRPPAQPAWRPMSGPGFGFFEHILAFLRFVKPPWRRRRWPRPENERRPDKARR